MKKSPVGIGIIGTGFARTTQIPGFRDCMGVKIVAVASRNRERAEAVAKEFGIRIRHRQRRHTSLHSHGNLLMIAKLAGREN